MMLRISPQPWSRSTAGVLIWRTLACALRISVVRRSGGQLIANGRIPIQATIASIEADEAAIEGDQRSGRAARVGRVGVIGHPVAKTAVVAKAVSPGPSPVAKTAVVAAAVTWEGGAPANLTAWWRRRERTNERQYELSRSQAEREVLPIPDRPHDGPLLRRKGS